MQGFELKLKDGFSIYGGVGVDIWMLKYWVFQLLFLLVFCKMKGYDFYGYYVENNGDGFLFVFYEQVSGIYNLFYLEIFLLFVLKYRVGNDMNLVFSFGFYIDLGFSGDEKREYIKYYYDMMEGNKIEFVINSWLLFGKWFIGGFVYGIGVEYGCFLIGGIGRVGCILWNYLEGFIDVVFEIGYCF